MTIERLHFEDGYPITLESINPDEQIKRSILENLNKIVKLPEGEYKLTPEWWTKHLHEHTLTVFADGTGLYRALPRENSVGTIDPKRGWEFTKGGRHFNIPQDQEIVAVSGPKKDRKTLAVYEVVLFIPGASPAK